MSFEGYYQILCKNGHKHSCDCYEEPMFTVTQPPYYMDMDDAESYPLWTCSCGAHATWWNLVDETNGSYCTAWDDEKNACCDHEYCDENQHALCKQKCGRIDGFVDLEVLEKQEVEVCKCCNNSKVVKERTYKIPEGVGHKVP